jgi:hypothetical protein
MSNKEATEHPLKASPSAELSSNDELFGYNLDRVVLNPLELTVAGVWLGFGLGFAKSWRTPALTTTALRRTAAIKAGGYLAAKVGAFAFVYSGMTLAARELRGVVGLADDSLQGPANVDVPSSVVAGSVTGLVFGAPMGAYAASVGLLRGGALGFGFGAMQFLSASAIERLEGLDEQIAQDAAASEAAAKIEGDGSHTRELAAHLDQMAKRMSSVPAPAPREPEK